MKNQQLSSKTSYHLASVGLVIVTLLSITAMPIWRWWIFNLEAQRGKNIAVYPISAETFLKKVDAMITAYSSNEYVDGVLVVSPPPGDIYLVARQFNFSPVLKLEAGQLYRLHIASVDCIHGASSSLLEQELFLTPGYATTVQIESSSSARQQRYVIQCSEYCGLGHNNMRGWFLIK